MKKKLSKLMIAMLMAIVVVGSLAVSKAAEGDGYYVEPADGYENLSYAGADATLFDVNDTYKGFCIDRDRGHYPTQTMYTETAEVITDPNNKVYQVFYYGYGGPEQGGVYTFANDTEAIVATSQAASHFYSSTSSGMNYTRAIENLSADKIPPAHTMSLSHTNMEAYVSGGSQVTDWITLTMDSRLSATATIPDGVTLYIEGDSTGYTGTATVPGGKRFYLSAGATADGIKTVTLKYTGNKMLKINVLAPPNNIYQPVAFFSSLNPSVSVNATFDGKGDLEIIKSSANPDMTDGNDCYSLAGAEYAVYGTYGNAFNDTSRITTITTDANGYGIATGLTLGTYYVKEITAPPGYRLDTSIYTVQVNSPTVATRLSVKDNPGGDPLEVVVRKKDAEEDVYLSGAKFVVKYYDVQMDTDPAEAGYTATRTWYLVTSGESGYEGQARLFDMFLDPNKTSDDFYYETGNPTLPLGTITVQEYEAPEGYIVDDTISVFKITDQQTSTPSVERLNERTITNQVMKQPFEIYKLGESKSGKLSTIYDGWVCDGKRLHNKKVFAGMEKADIFNQKTEALIQSVYDTSVTELRVVNGDGASWIKNTYEPDRIFQLDRFHIKQEITRCISNKHIQRMIFERLHDNKIDEMLEVIETYINSIDDGTNESDVKKAKTLFNYLFNNYDGLLPWQLQAGIVPEAPEGITYKNMGVQENQNCSLVCMRMKGRKMRWSINGANNLAKLIYMKENGDLDRIIEKSDGKIIIPEDIDLSIDKVLSADKIKEKVGKGNKWMELIQATMPMIKYNGPYADLLRSLER